MAVVDSPAHLLSLKVMRVSVCLFHDLLSRCSSSPATRGSKRLATFFLLLTSFLCTCLCLSSVSPRKYTPSGTPKDSPRSHPCFRYSHSPLFLWHYSTRSDFRQLPLHQQRSSLLGRFHPHPRRNADGNRENTPLPDTRTLGNVSSYRRYPRVYREP